MAARAIRPVVVEDAYWRRDAPELLAALATTAEGLSSAEAAERLARHGANVVQEQREVAAVRLLLRQFASPLVLILVFGAVISLVARGWVDAIIRPHETRRWLQTALELLPPTTEGTFRTGMLQV